MIIALRDKKIGHSEPTFIVGEIGINHNGDVSIAKQLIDVAVEAGCDAVKFQKRTIPIVYTKEELLRPREVPAHLISSAMKRKALPEENMKRLVASHLETTTNGDLKWALEFTRDEYKEIDAYCTEKGIVWFASPWDEESVDFLDDLDIPCFKIASASLTDDALLLHIKSKKKPIIVSTGMSTESEVDHALTLLRGTPLIVLHTVSTYPSDDVELNLSLIPVLREKYHPTPIGYSGHERGISPSFAAVVLGACLVERHITLDRTMWGSDQAASIEPKGLKLLVRDIRTFEKARGDGMKRLLQSEVPIREKLRRK